jgi:Alpha-glutamyl/putrescinyl thymine pyrophosphorylase clade 3
MNKADSAIAEALEKALLRHARYRRKLPGVSSASARQSFIAQLIESRRRVEYVRRIAARDVSTSRADPSSTSFDPLKAALYFMRRGDLDEAMWLVFLATHFGKSSKGGWERVRSVYGGLGTGGTWTWTRTSANPTAFRNWLDANRQLIPGRFGNHRKYESLSGTTAAGTGHVVETYVNWVRAAGGHSSLLQSALIRANQDPGIAFDDLYTSMNAVSRFGRTAKFDYLTMVSKLGFARIEPHKPYMGSATGPRKGAYLLFRGKLSATESAKSLDQWTFELGTELELGMQEMEDALCNWQKSPTKFKPFRG